MERKKDPLPGSIPGCRASRQIPDRSQIQTFPNPSHGRQLGGRCGRILAKAVGQRQDKAVRPALGPGCRPMMFPKATLAIFELAMRTEGNQSSPQNASIKYLASRLKERFWTQLGCLRSNAFAQDKLPRRRPQATAKFRKILYRMTHYLSKNRG